jgi:hypothetical protein
MRLGEVVVAPGVKRALSIDWDDYYLGADTISGAPTWSAGTGITLSGAAFSSNVATVYAIPSQEGCDYNVVCSITLASGATEEGLIVVKCRTGDADARLTA